MTNEPPYLRIAGLVRAGEWTTYGDLSMAVRGDANASRAVGRLAATHPGFPNPHRVLRAGGRPADAGGDWPEESRRRLEAEGVRFGPGGVADPARYVEWHELVSRREGHEAGSVENR